MSIGYNNMYNISAGIFSVFSSKNPNKRLYNVNHSENKREQMKKFFPINKYNDFTKENFILANLYINFKESPSSLNSVFEKLKNLDMKKVYLFKNEIINYRKLISKDVERINNEETGTTLSYMLDEYRMNKIYWFTLYFYALAYSEDCLNHPTIINSRINKKLVENIKKLLLYVSFSPNTKKEMSSLIEDKIAI